MTTATSNTTVPAAAVGPASSADAPFEIFLAASPGLESFLAAEAREKGFVKPVPVKGGVTMEGGWPEVWRANLELRGATRVLARVASFRAFHLAQLDKRARRVPWTDVLRPGTRVQVEAATSKGSRIYHSGAAAERIAKAIGDAIGAPAGDDTASDGAVTIMARIEDNHCTLSVDTSGELLHKRGLKDAVHRAPLRETLAALFLRAAGYGGGEPVMDPMCGSGTFVIEAAEIAAGLAAGRARTFGFEQLASFDAEAWCAMREARAAVGPLPALCFAGSDRDAGAVAMSRANAARAGVGAITHFGHHAVSALVRPDGPPGLVITNPPYGNRLGDKLKLTPLYRAFGETMLQHFSGWRVGLVTSEAALARATGLPFGAPVARASHGGIRVELFVTGPLA